MGHPAVTQKTEGPAPPLVVRHKCLSTRRLPLFTRMLLTPAVHFRLFFTYWCSPLRCHGRAESGWPCDGVLVEASLQHEGKATANGRREFVVLLKQRRTLVG